ncbi:metal-dependent hydrolase [Natronobiforma cellulositropha]|uniref:metal-dependent hydrolase n=1 Tax=Natronobiforma cellulositropha TaxID=1679076 RepID=UPI0021D5CC78|nr:metal-dependent hydrolase [Natronobiforma cellulositropha]
MWPWGHLAVAYLLYTLYTRRRYGRPPEALALAALLLGSQVPDLIDKPLAWSLGVLPGGRTLGHSLLFAALLLPAVYALAIRLRRVDVATAFAIGHLSHLLADLPPGVLVGDFSDTEFLLWPLTQPETYESVDSVTGGFLGYSMGTYEWIQLGLFVVALAVWYRDGTPGLASARLTLERYTSLGR